ncbi:aspartate aminotransferase family protein [Streptomyces sp. NPDC059398]|uniref:aspartate aminotransferase family protein n=1 Tax=Streptomyces sp. NPDC059398 TaxID=3346820 RepID=UPI00368075F9
MAEETALHGAWRARATKALAGGVSSNVRMLNPHVIADRAEGARMWDVDGREYIDYVLGQGPNFLGNAPRQILEKVEAAQRRGVIYAATHRTEIEAAEKVIEVLGWPDRVRFGSSSSEMVQAALRMARHATGRSRVLRFHGQYHGWFDNIHIRSDGDTALPAGGGQLPQALDEVVTVQWNDRSAFDEALAAYGDELAAVIMEPVMLNSGAIEPGPGYLRAVRDACTANGTVLVFDETITGFRLAVGGAAERYGVYPDLAVYGKAMAGGWPCAAVVGRGELFEGIATGAVVHAGTFNGNVPATAATLACLEHIADGEVHRRTERVGGQLMSSLAALSAEHGLGLVLQGPPMAFHARFADPPTPATRYQDVQNADSARYLRFSRALVGHGVWVASRGIWYVSAAHTEQDVALTVDRVAGAVHALH